MRVFAALEAETMPPLPPTSLVLARWSTAAVGPDIHIKAGRTLLLGALQLIGSRGNISTSRLKTPVWCRTQASEVGGEHLSEVPYQVVSLIQLGASVEDGLELGVFVLG